LEEKEDPRRDVGRRSEFEKSGLRVGVLRDEAEEEVGVFEEGGEPVSVDQNIPGQLEPRGEEEGSRRESRTNVMNEVRPST